MAEYVVDTTFTVRVEAMDEAGALRIAEEQWADIADALVPYEPKFWTSIEPVEA